MTEQQLRLLNDARLSDAARILGFYLSTLPEGPNEIPHDGLAALLHGCPNAETVGRHLRQLHVFGYARRVSSGGIGSPRYEWLESSTPENSRAESALPPKIHGQKAVVVERKIEVLPPSPPSLHPLSVNAMQAISTSAEKLEGCRGALVDYLQARVPELRQYGYVQSVVSWIDNPKQVFQMADGMPVPAGERVKLLAVALNEMAASDESGYAAPSGDPRNVKNKLFSLSRGFGRVAVGGKQARASPRGGPADAQTYTPTETWEGFNG